MLAPLERESYQLVCEISVAINDLRYLDRTRDRATGVAFFLGQVRCLVIGDLLGSLYFLVQDAYGLVDVLFSASYLFQADGLFKICYI